MQKIEEEIVSTSECSNNQLAHFSSAEDREEIHKLRGNLAAIVKDALEKSKIHLKLEALDAVSGSEWLQQSLTIEKKISMLLSQALNKAHTYERSSKDLRDRTTNLIVAASGVAILLSVFIEIVPARGIGIPLGQLAETAEKIGQGDLRVEAPPIKRKDEIGKVGDSFRQMLANLKEQMAQVRDVVESLSGVVSDLSASLSQLSLSASNTNAAIREVTTTMAQVSQAAIMSHEKADQVARTSKEALKATSSGGDATEQTMLRALSSGKASNRLHVL